LKATFTLTTADFHGLQKVIGKRVSRQTGWASPLFFLRFFPWFCIGLAGATYVRVVRDNPDIAQPLKFVGFMLLAAILVLVVMPYAQRMTLRKYMLCPTGTFLSPQAVQFSDHALVIESDLCKSEFTWSRIIAHEEDEKNHYLFVDAMQAIVLPRAAASSFAAEIDRLIPNAKNRV